MSPESLKRPAGATFLALVLGWLGIAGILNSFVRWSVPTEFVAQASPQLQSALRVVRSPVMSLIPLIYGLSALAACVYLWRMKSQMRTAMSIWVASVAVLAVYLSVTMPRVPTTLLAELVFFVPSAFLLTALWLYVSRLSKPLHSNYALERTVRGWRTAPRARGPLFSMSGRWHVGTRQRCNPRSYDGGAPRRSLPAKYHCDRW